MTVKELRSLWDAEIEAKLAPALKECGYRRSGKGWIKSNAAKSKQALLSFERTALKNHLRVVLYSDVWMVNRRQDEFGWATGTLAGELPLLEWKIADPSAVSTAADEAAQYVINEALPYLAGVLDSEWHDLPGVRVGRLDELG